MKNRLILAFLFISVSSSAQLIHVEGSKALGINYAYVKNGFNISSRITFYKSGNLAYRGSLDFERVEFDLCVHSEAKLNTIFLQINTYKTIFQEDTTATDPATGCG